MKKILVPLTLAALVSTSTNLYAQQTQKDLPEILILNPNDSTLIYKSGLEDTPSKTQLVNPKAPPHEILYTAEDSLLIKQDRLQLRMHLKVYPVEIDGERRVVPVISEIFFEYQINGNINKGYIGGFKSIKSKEQLDFLDRYQDFIERIIRSYNRINKAQADTLDINYRNF